MGHTCRLWWPRSQTLSWIPWTPPAKTTTATYRESHVSPTFAPMLMTSISGFQPFKMGLYPSPPRFQDYGNGSGKPDHSRVRNVSQLLQRHKRLQKDPKESAGCSGFQIRALACGLGWSPGLKPPSLSKPVSPGLNLAFTRSPYRAHQVSRLTVVSIDTLDQPVLLVSVYTHPRLPRNRIPRMFYCTLQ